MPQTRTDTGLRLLLLLASFVVICAGLKAASEIVVPVLAAMFVAIISVPPLQFLQRKGFPNWLAGSLVFTIVFLLVLIAGAFATRYAAEISSALPEYRTEIEERVDILVDEHGMVVEAHYCKDTADHLPIDRLVEFSKGN